MEAQAQTTRASAPLSAEVLAHRLSGVLEPAMRRHMVWEQLVGATPAEACAVMGEVLRRPPGDGPDWRWLRDIIHDLLLSHPDGTPCGLSYGLRRAIYEAASQSGDHEVMRLLRSELAEQPAEEEVQRLPPDLADLPLGRRRSLAKGADSHWLERLALDPDVHVVRNLLCNPRLREAEVVRIAATRPAAPSTLHSIAASSRWSFNTAVRTAVVRNPCCPSDLAIKLLVSLPLQTLRSMRADCDLHPETQKELLRELTRRETSGARP